MINNSNNSISKYTNNPIKKNEQKGRIDIFAKKTYRWSTGPGKEAQGILWQSDR